MIDVLEGSFGIPIVLRIIGGLGMLQGTVIVASRSVESVADAAVLGARNRDNGCVRAAFSFAMADASDNSADEIKLVRARLDECERLVDESHEPYCEPDRSPRMEAILLDIAAARDLVGLFSGGASSGVGPPDWRWVSSNRSRLDSLVLIGSVGPCG